MSEIIVGDALSVLKTLPDQMAQMCVTSPPYWGLRDYGVGGQLGLEASLDEYLQNMVMIFREVKRVLKDDGTLWVNIGDTYLQQKGRGFNGNKRLPERDRDIKVKRPEGIKPKNLLGLPWRFAFALQADGWYLRSDIIWEKPNAMPESCKDRPSRSHEYLFLFSKKSRYYYDIDATRKPHKKDGRWSTKRSTDTKYGRPEVQNAMRSHTFHTQVDLSNVCHPNGKNIRTVWTIPTRGFPGAHFATFPPDLIEPCIRAGSAPRTVVLDPFGGAGTTGLVSEALNRQYILIELNPEYARLAKERIARGGDVGRPLKPTRSPQLEMRLS